MASGVYTSVTKIPSDSTASENVTYGPVSATPAAFPLKGGVYSFSALGTFVSCTLETLGPDQSTYLPVGTSTTLSAAGFASGIYLPSGMYKVVIS